MRKKYHRKANEVRITAQCHANAVDML